MFFRRRILACAFAKRKKAKNRVSVMPKIKDALLIISVCTDTLLLGTQCAINADGLWVSAWLSLGEV